MQFNQMAEIPHKYNLIVIGTGVAASTVAWECRSAGWKTAAIDSRPFGGTCALRGCDPKKVLVGGAELIDWARRMHNKGISSAGTSNFDIDWTDLIRFKRTFTEPVPQEREDVFNKSGIASFHGNARFTGSNTIRITDDKNNIEQAIDGEKILIATGAKPAKLNIAGEENVVTSENFLELDELPDNVLFIGGGYISFEFAHLAARAGSNVTILHRGKKPLAGFDPDLVNILLSRSRELGINVKLESSVKKIVSKDNGKKFDVHLSTPENSPADNNENNIIETGLVIHGAGRIPDTDNLDLRLGNVQIEQNGGIKVNEFLQSVSNPSVYAAGDAAATKGIPLTPVATYEGQIVAQNLLKGNHQKPNYDGIPSVVFTIPPLASVGLQENMAKQLGLQFRINFKDTSSWYSSRRIRETCSGYKVLIEHTTGRILGAHLLGTHSEEVINLFALAIRLGLGAEVLKNGIYSYPTNSSDITYML
jgi:glutathione reductase (NADPH)